MGHVGHSLLAGSMPLTYIRMKQCTTMQCSAAQVVCLPTARLVNTIGTTHTTTAPTCATTHTPAWHNFHAILDYHNREREGGEGVGGAILSVSKQPSHS